MNKLKQILEKALKSESAFFDFESGELNYTQSSDKKVGRAMASLEVYGCQV